MTMLDAVKAPWHDLFERLLAELDGASVSSPGRSPHRGGARVSAGGGVMSDGTGTATHDPSVGVRRRHLPIRMGRQGFDAEEF